MKQICKPKYKINRSNSPSMTSATQSVKQRGGNASPPPKFYKHVALFLFNNMNKVCDILHNGEGTDLLGIVCRLPGEKDKFYYFKIMAMSSSSRLN